MEIWYYHQAPSETTLDDIVKKSILSEETIALDAESNMARHGHPGFSIYFFQEGSS